MLEYVETTLPPAHTVCLGARTIPRVRLCCANKTPSYSKAQTYIIFTGILQHDLTVHPRVVDACEVGWGWSGSGGR